MECPCMFRNVILDLTDIEWLKSDEMGLCDRFNATLCIGGNCERAQFERVYANIGLTIGIIAGSLAAMIGVILAFSFWRSRQRNNQYEKIIGY